MKKLQEVRVKLQKMNLRKSGRNTYANFSYYELADILPAINELCLENDLITNFSIENQIAILTISSTEKATNTANFVQFKAPFVIPVIKGGNEVQNLGAGITYMRRYLLMMAFEIIESDVSDAIMQNTPKSAITSEKKEKPSTSIGEDKSLAQTQCIFGKNKGKKWSEMSLPQLNWYRDFLNKNTKKSFTDALALETITELIEKANETKDEIPHFSIGDGNGK